MKNKQNQPNVETFTTTCTSCNKYPQKNHKLKLEEFIYRSEVANEKLGNMSVEECQKLFGIKPTDLTIEEVKKEWEDDNYKWIETKDEILLVFLLEHDHKEIFINKKDKKFACTGIPTNFITFKEHIRLTKTFRALGWEV